ncbi:MAG: TerB family tellurite resistance protein, partial [Myxococcales bacterium]
MSRHNGAVAGAMLGVAIGALVGGSWPLLLGVAGLFAGRLFDKLHDPDEAELKAPAETAAEIDRDARGRFARHLAALLFKVARADGSIADEEVQVVDRYFVERLGFADDEHRAVDEAFAHARSFDGSLEDAARACREAMSL